jgi:beta-phosphoglucomutase
MNRLRTIAPFRAAIFDLDGVLVDTAEFHFQAWKIIAEELGVPFDRCKNERLRGIPRMASLAIIVEDMPVKPTNLERLAERKNARYVEMIGQVRPTDLLPGVPHLLSTLRKNHVPIALGSSSKNAREVLRNLEIENVFDAVVDGYGFDRAKPAPDVFINAADALEAAPHECVVVEDAPAGIVAANAAGMYAVGISRKEPLPGADLVVTSSAEIPVSLWGIASCA